MYNFLTIIIGIGFLLFLSYDDYKTRMQNSFQQQQEFQANHYYQIIGEAVVATEHQFFHTTGITLEEISIASTNYTYKGFAYLHIQGVYDDSEKRSYRMKLRRKIAKKWMCKPNEIPFEIDVYNDYVDIIPKICI